VHVIDEILFEAEEKMEKAVGVARDDFATLRTGRASAAMFAKVFVDYYGVSSPLNQVASFQVPEPRMIVISPFDKGAMGEIERAIRDSDLGVNPSNDGKVIRVMLPMLTEERRREYVKVARTMAEDARISIRSIRRQANSVLDKLMKDGEAREDEAHRAEKQLDDVTGKYVGHVDDMLKNKEAELLEV